jgi:molecular chaperone DnaK (HSP70)
MEGVNFLENDVVEKVLEDHERILNKHDQQIEKLQENQTKILITQAEMSMKLSSIDAGQSDIKKSITENALEQRKFESDLITKLVDNSSQNQTKMWDFGFKGLALLGTVLGIISLVLKLKFGS